MWRKHSLIQSYKSSQCLFLVHSPAFDFFDATAEASGAGSLLMAFKVCPSRLNVRSSCSVVALEMWVAPFQSLERVSVLFSVCIPVFLSTLFICSALSPGPCGVDFQGSQPFLQPLPMPPCPSGRFP